MTAKYLNEYWEVKNVMDTSYGEGFVDGEAKGKIKGEIKGKREGKMEVAIVLKQQGLETAIIMNATGLSREEIENL